MNSRRLFAAGCLALVTSAFSFMIRQNVADAMAAEFLFTKMELGTVLGTAFLGQAIAMFVVSPLCDSLGLGRVTFLAFLCHLVGIAGTILAPKPPLASHDVCFWTLCAATFLVGAGNGLVELFINPLAATLYPREKTHYLNVLHAWWPGGLIASGLLVTLLGGDAGPDAAHAAGLSWKAKMGLIFVPLAAYGLLALGQKFPETERVQAKVPAREMFLEALRPMFLLWAFCMLLTAAMELGPNQWQESVLKRTAGVSGTLVFVYTSGLMFSLRFFAGPVAHRLSPVGMLAVSSLVAAIGLYWLSAVDTPVMAFVAATVFGVGVAFVWPTMLGVTAERFPKGGAFLLGLLGCFGNLSISQVLPQMGAIYDSYTVANLPRELEAKSIAGPDGQPLALVTEGDPSWLPAAITRRIHPAGNRKLNPEARQALEASQGPDLTAVRQAEAVGAAYAFRWVAVLPGLLVLIFGAVALLDRLRGGYRPVQLGPASPPG